MAKSPLCSIPDCGKPHKVRGLCWAHYERLRSHGDPLAGRTPSGDLLRFIENIALQYEGDDCLIWPFGKDKDGYGKILFNGRYTHAHRVVCELAHDLPPTQNHEAAHSCGKGHLGCVTKGHLSWKTSAENKADELIHGTRQRGELHSSVKLTESQVREIRALRGVFIQPELAERFGVSANLISKVQLRQVWAWLD